MVWRGNRPMGIFEGDKRKLERFRTTMPLLKFSVLSRSGGASLPKLPKGTAL